jgi:nitric oxide reductase subunit B
MSSANTHFGGLRFMRLGMLALAGGMVFGVIGGFQFLFPEFLQELLFTKTRPLHVSLVVSSIFLIAIGGVYFYLPRQCNLPLFSSKSVDLHYWVFLLTGLAIIVSYLSGRFGGREYFEFPPILSLPIFLTWLLFGINYFNTVRQDKEPWPVYYWMWGTGVVFFFITYAESHLYLIPYFRETMVREIMVQWKSYGALTGSWNMLVYGTGLYLATKISGCDKYARSKLAFGLYFLGLFNLMFGWAHHTYLVPSDPWIRTFAYLVSMTELYIFGKIIWDWRSSLTDWQKNRHCNAYRFLVAADIWIFVNLGLALIISIPALNLFTHGTHITVAHAMGSTIGINMMILLASVFYVIREELPDEIHAKCSKQLRTGFWITNVSLAIFFVALLLAGIGKGVYDGSSFQEMMLGIRPFLITFAISGVALTIGMWIILWHGFRLMGKIMVPVGVAEPQPA